MFNTGFLAPDSLSLAIGCPLPTQGEHAPIYMRDLFPASSYTGGLKGPSFIQYFFFFFSYSVMFDSLRPHVL